jgi:hypothetical protein
MKRTIISAACISCFLLAAIPSNAQQAKATATEAAATLDQKPAAQSKSKDLKVPPQPGSTEVQQSAEKPVQVVVSKTFKPVEPKAVELKNAPAENSNSMQNIDRLKTSTIQPDKKERPLANEGPKVPEKQQ